MGWNLVKAADPIKANVSWLVPVIYEQLLSITLFQQRYLMLYLLIIIHQALTTKIMFIQVMKKNIQNRKFKQDKVT